MRTETCPSGKGGAAAAMLMAMVVMAEAYDASGIGDGHDHDHDACRHEASPSFIPASLDHARTVHSTQTPCRSIPSHIAHPPSHNQHPPSHPQASTDPAVRVLVITGTGPYYSAGNDLSNFTSRWVRLDG